VHLNVYVPALQEYGESAKKEAARKAANNWGATEPKPRIQCARNSHRGNCQDKKPQHNASQNLYDESACPEKKSTQGLASLRNVR
jgi:hypothetical protein